MLRSLMILMILTMMLMSMRRRSANWSQSISWHVIAVGKFNLTIIIVTVLILTHYTFLQITNGYKHHRHRGHLQLWFILYWHVCMGAKTLTRLSLFLFTGSTSTPVLCPIAESSLWLGAAPDYWAALQTLCAYNLSAGDSIDWSGMYRLSTRDLLRDQIYFNIIAIKLALKSRQSALWRVNYDQAYKEKIKL